MSDIIEPDNSLTLQINSKAALERLLGGDSKLEVALRHSVASVFAKQHLEAITRQALTTEREQMSARVAELVRGLLTAEERSATTWVKTIKLTPDVRNLIKSELETLASAYVSEQLTALSRKIDEEVAAYAKKVPALVEQKFKRTFDAAVDAAVRARLEEIRKLLPVEEETRKISVS